MFPSFFVLASLFARLAPLAKMKKAAARFLFEVSSGGFEGLLS
jgi:hypothetical protein